MENERNQRQQPCEERRDNVDDPIQVLLCFRQTMDCMNEQLTKLTINDMYEATTNQLEQIEQFQAQVEHYLLEESFARLATYQEQSNDVIIQHIPDGIRFLPTPEGVSILGIPLWMMGHKSKKKFPPIYHRDRPMIRKIPMWHAIVHHLKVTYLQSVWKGNSVLPEKPSGYAHVLLHFHTDHLQTRDLDHYDVAPVINACVSNGLLLSDHPKRLSFTTIWDEDTDQPQLDVRVRYLTDPTSLPLDLSVLLGLY